MRYVVRWSLLKKVANSKYAKLTVLVPIIGWLLIANDEVAKLVAKLTDQASIAQPSWKIYALHAGLSIFGIGVGFFYLICPTRLTNIQTIMNLQEMIDAQLHLIKSNYTVQL